MAALAFVSPGVAQSIYPPGGDGLILVTVLGIEEEFTGCLNLAGQWIITGDCGFFFGDGMGNVRGLEGYLGLNEEDSTIIANGDMSTTAWVGTHEDNGRNAANLQAAVINSDIAGGPQWYSDNLPENFLSGRNITATPDENMNLIVTLTFLATSFDEENQRS